MAHSLERIAKFSFFLVSLAALVSIVSQRALWIFSIHYPITADAFYYLVEMRSYAASGDGYYTHLSPFFLIASVIGRIAGDTDTELYARMVIISLTIFSIAVALPLSNRKMFWLVPAAACLAWGPDVLFYRNNNYLRQGFALAVLFLGAAMLLKDWTGASPRIKAIARAAGFFFCTLGAFVHALATLIAVVLFIFHAPLKLPLKALLAAIAAAGFLVFLAVNDKELFELGSRGSQFGWQIACRATDCSPSDRAEFFFQALSLLAFITLLAFNAGNTTLAALVTLYILFNTALWDYTGGMAYRLATASVWLIVFGWTAALRNDVKQRTAVAFCILFIAAASASYTLGHNVPEARRPWVEAMERYSEKLKRWIPIDAFVVARRPTSFAVKYFLDRNSGTERVDTSGYTSVFRIGPKTELPVPGMNAPCVALDAAEDVEMAAADCVSIGSSDVMVRERSPQQPIQH